MMLFLKKVMWVLLPFLAASLLVGCIYFFGYADRNIVLRSSLPFTVLSIGGALSILTMLLSLIKMRRNKLLTKTLVQQKQNSTQEHKRFVQRLDHELKNPLTSIQVGLENIKRNAAELDVKTVDSLLDQTKRLGQLTTDLRKIAVLDEQSLEFEPVNTSDLLHDLEQMTSELESGRNIDLILPSAPWPVPNILADRDLLELALYNIVENAVKYSDGSDRIEIRANDDRKFVKIEIADTGLGLADEEQNQVWEELFRGSNISKRSGTGIGLSLVKKIVELHKGKIEFHSKLNVGTRVSIYLPVVKAN